LETNNDDIRRWVDEWVVESDGGWFWSPQIWSRFNIITSRGKNTVWQRLKEHAKAGRIEKDGLRYRKKDTSLEDIDIFQEDKFVHIKFPFDLDKYIRLTERSQMVAAGGKDTAKTALLINIAYLNMYDWEVHYFDSESGATLLKERLLAIDPDLPNPLPFKIHPRMSNFSDVIVPNALNIIDYLDLDSEYQMVGTELRRLVEALDKGVVIVGLQKPPPGKTKDGKIIERTWGYGGAPTIKRAQVALSLDVGKIKIVAAKSRANRKVNPINKTWTYRLDETGSRFLDIKSEGSMEFQF